MNRREKIIIVGALLVGAYGALDYFVFSDDKADNGGAEKADKEIKDFSDLAAIQLTASEKIDSRHLESLITRGEEDWSKNPFHQHMQGDQDVEKEEEVVEEVTVVIDYSGYILAGKRILAVINGMEYKTGDMLLGLGYRVSSITPLRVVLETGVGKEIIIPLQEN